MGAERTRPAPYRLWQRVTAKRDFFQAAPALLPALIATLSFVVLGLAEGGYFPTARFPWALFLLVLFGLTAVTLGRPSGLPRPTLVAVCLLLAYTAWTFLSVLWAGQAGDAWDGATRTAAYALVFCLFTLWPMHAWGGRLIMSVFSLGVAAAGLLTLLRASFAADPDPFFIEVRLTDPVGYTNANAGLWTLALLACVYLASRREVGAAARAALLAGGGFLGGLALMAQSRGWALVLPVAVIVLLALTPNRVRTAGAALLVALGVAAVSGPVLAVHDDFRPGRLPELIDATVAPLLLMSAVLAVVGLLWAAADTRVSPSAEASKRIGRLAGALTAGVVVLALAGFVIAEGSPVAKASDAWDSFKGGGSGSAPGESRFTGGATNRYDFWVVAWDVFGEHPVAGIGADTFQEEYLARGSSPEQPRYAHSFELGVLQQTGLVGFLLLGGALVAACVAAVRSRHGPPPAAACAAGAVAIFAYWLLHASVDWFWEFPALAAPALALLGLAGALAPRGPAAFVRKPFSRPALAVAGVAGVLLAVGCALPWMAALDISRAAGTWRENPGAAMDRLDRAAALQPLSPRAQLVEGTIALRVGMRDVAERSFREALERDPDLDYALLELGLLAAEKGDRERALPLLERAARANPTDQVTKEALEGVREGREVSIDEVNRRILEGARERAR